MEDEDDFLPDGWFRVAVAGESFRNPDGSDRQVEICCCCAGEAVMLDPEPDNPHDPNAVRVVSSRGVQIGYVSRAAAAQLVRDLESGCPYQAAIDKILSRDDGPKGVVLRVAFDWDE